MKINLITVCAILIAKTVLFSQDSSNVVVQRTYTNTLLNETKSRDINGLLDDQAWNVVA